MVHGVFVRANRPWLLFELSSFYLKAQIAVITIYIRNQRQGSWLRIRSRLLPLVVASFIVIVRLGVHVGRSHRKGLLAPKRILVIKVILGLVQMLVLCGIKFVLIISSMPSFPLVCFLRRIWLVIEHDLIGHQRGILVIVILLSLIRILRALLHKLLTGLSNKFLVLVGGLADLLSVVIGCLRDDLPVFVSVIANNLPIVIGRLAYEFAWL